LRYFVLRATNPNQTLKKNFIIIFR